MIVKENDKVSMGDALFFDKNNPDVKWPAIASGIIAKIVYGERRAVQEIIIEIDSEIEDSTSSVGNLSSTSKDDIKEFLTEKNMWPFITQRPFNKVVNPQDEPKCIIVSLADSSPLASDLSFSLDHKKDDIVSALSVLKKTN
jgi:Na+-transporting NADH:ubiquinone oxidoreductase subunit A